MFELDGLLNKKYKEGKTIDGGYNTVTIYEPKSSRYASAEESRKPIAIRIGKKPILTEENVIRTRRLYKYLKAASDNKISPELYYVGAIETGDQLYEFTTMEAYPQSLSDYLDELDVDDVNFNIRDKYGITSAIDVLVSKIYRTMNCLYFDIKPANIVIDFPLGELRFIDFDSDFCQWIPPMELNESEYEMHMDLARISFAFFVKKYHGIDMYKKNPKVEHTGTGYMLDFYDTLRNVEYQDKLNELYCKYNDGYRKAGIWYALKKKKPTKPRCVQTLYTMIYNLIK
jgi:hypothetical protein